jgi:voltage-gated sodium channel
MADDDAKEAAPAGMAPWRFRARAFVERRAVQNLILWLIVVNAVTLGLETSPTAMAAAGPMLIAIDRTILAVFVVEIALRLAAHGWRFFRDPWSIFDFIVVAIALVPASGQFSVLRALRILRVLRLISAVPRMRRVVTALLSAIPGLGAIIALLSLIFYVSAVMATKLFGASFPDWFGTIGESLYSLFQIMTLESWSMGIVRPVLEVYSLAWLFFVPFILITTFTTLNLFIAVIVNAMQAEHDREAEAAEAEAKGERGALLEELQAVRRELAELRAELGRGGATGS